MAASARSKNAWVLVLLLLAGVVLGSFIGHITNGVSWLSWLDYGMTFGLTNPVTLDVGVLVLTFGLTIHFSIASIIGIVVAAIIYHFI
ncbi:MAG: DUF4321 domain-containing protein [Eubacterium sp.]|nr:DUF4321 domain-containing protein [Eubacterium sp.]